MKYSFSSNIRLVLVCTFYFLSFLFSPVIHIFTNIHFSSMLTYLLQAKCRLIKRKTKKRRKKNDRTVRCYLIARTHHCESDYMYKCQVDGKIFDSHMYRIFNLIAHEASAHKKEVKKLTIASKFQYFRQINGRMFVFLFRSCFC